MKTKLFAVCLLFLSMLMFVASCGKPKTEARLPNATFALESNGQKTRGTLAEELSRKNLTQIKAAAAILGMFEKELKDDLGDGVIISLKEALEGISDNNYLYSSLLVNVDVSRLTPDVFEDDTPDRFLNSIEFLVHFAMAEKATPVFEGIEKALRKCKLIDVADFSAGSFKGVEFSIKDMDEDFKNMPKIALAYNASGMDLFLGFSATVKNAAEGNLKAPYANELKTEFSEYGKDASFLAIVPPASWMTDSILENVPADYRPLIVDLKAITLASTADKSTIGMTLSARYGNAENAFRLKSEFIDTFVLKSGKEWLAEALEGVELPALQTLAAKLDGNRVSISVSLTAKDMEIFEALHAATMGKTLSQPRISRNKAKEIACLNNLKQLGLATLMYTMDYDDYLPPQKDCETVLRDYVGSHKMVCPEGNEQYIFLADGQNTTKLDKPSATILAICPNDHNGRRNALFADGHVESIDSDVVMAAIENAEEGKLPVID